MSHQKLDRNLTSNVLKGDRSARFQLFELTKGMLLSICCRVMNDEDEANDALQDSYVEIFPMTADCFCFLTIQNMIIRFYTSSQILCMYRFIDLILSYKRSKGLKLFITLGKAGGIKLIQDRNPERAKLYSFALSGL